MTDYVQTVVNPGGETGSASPWVGTVQSNTSVHHTGGNTVVPHSGSRLLGNATNFSQSITVTGPTSSAIDHGQCTITLTAWHQIATFALGNEVGHLAAQFYTADGTLLQTSTTADTQPISAWTQETLTANVPSGTRTIAIGGGGSSFHTDGNCWDDFALTVTDTGVPNLAAAARATQVVAYALASQPAAAVKASQVAALAVSFGETATGLPVKVHQAVAYALVKGKVDRVDLRAWTFLQDDHLFYGLQLGNIGTIVHDVSTGQWTQWQSPGFAYFRAEDVTDWEGFNLACDTENGTIWKIDPTGRLDSGTTAIASTVTGMATVRFRRTVPCYMAELSVSEAHPPIDGTSIQLRTSDDATETFNDQGTIDAEAAGTATLFRWYGLGLMQAPGRVFQILNNGYARRIDGLDIEIGGAS